MDHECGCWYCCYHYYYYYKYHYQGRGERRGCCKTFCESMRPYEQRLFLLLPSPLLLFPSSLLFLLLSSPDTQPLFAFPYTALCLFGAPSLSRASLVCVNEVWVFYMFIGVCKYRWLSLLIHYMWVIRTNTCRVPVRSVRFLGHPNALFQPSCSRNDVSMAA